MEIFPFLLCFIAWLLGGICNGITGLGAAIVAYPFVILVADTKDIAYVNSIMGLPMCFLVGWQWRQYFRLSDILPLLISALITMIAGMLVISILPSRLVQVIVGILFIIYMIWQLLITNPPQIKNQVRSGLFFGGIAGFIQAISGVGGPPVAMFVQLAKWDQKRARADMSFLFVGLCVPIFLIILFSGQFTRSIFNFLVPCVIGCIIGLIISVPIAKRVSEGNFQRSLTGIIGFAGLMLLFRACFFKSPLFPTNTGIPPSF